MDVLLKDYKNTKQTILQKLKNKENFCKTKENFIKSYCSEEKNIIYKNIPGFNNISNIFKSIPNQITNVSTITDFAGSFGSSLKNTLYNQLSIENNNNTTSTNLIAEKSKEKREKRNKYNVDTIGKLIEMKNIKKTSITNNTNIPIDNSDLTENAYNPYVDSSQSLRLIRKNDNADLNKTKQILFELSDLMTNFSMKVHQHQEMTQEIMNLSTQSVDNIQKANKELKISQEYQKGRGLMIGLIFVLLGVFLIYYDYAI